MGWRSLPDRRVIRSGGADEIEREITAQAYGASVGAATHSYSYSRGSFPCF